VVEATVPPHHGTPLWRRIWAVVASTVLAVVSGALIATVVAVGLAFAVVTLTDMLKR
jgi:ABC-type Fe3+ transport system permease subunit